MGRCGGIVGRRNLTGGLCAALALVGAPGGALADPLARGKAVAEGLAPAGEWPMQDGNPARTRATPTAFPDGPWVVAWKHTAPADLAGDPCVSGDRVVLGTEVDGGGTSFVEVLRLSDGKPAAPRLPLKSGQPALLATHRDFVVAPSKEGELTMLRIPSGGGRLVAVATMPGFPNPAVIDGDVVAVTSLGIERRRMGAKEPKWSVHLRHPSAGPPSVRAGRVYVVTSGPLHGYVGVRVMLEMFDLETGRDSPLELGWEPKGRQSGEASRVVVGHADAYALHPPGLALKQRGPIVGVHVPLEGDRQLGLFDFVGLPLSAGERDFFWVSDPEEEPSLRFADRRRASKKHPPRTYLQYVIATPKRHDNLLAHGPFGVVAAGVVHLPGGAFEAESLHVTRFDTPAVKTRRIPVRETLLEVSGRTLTAWRQQRTASSTDPGPTLPRTPGAAPMTLAGVAVVGQDGVARTGDFTYAPATGLLSGPGKAKTSVALDELGLVTDRDGRIVHGPDPDFVLRALSTAAMQRDRGKWLALARRAVATRSAAALNLALDDLAARGGTSDELAPLRLELIKLEKPQGAPPKIDAAIVTECERARTALLEAEGDALRRAVATLADDVPLAYREPLLRAVLVASPRDPAVADWLRARLPAGFAIEHEPHPGDWIDLIKAVRRVPVKVLEKKKEAPDLTMDERVFGSLRHTWRPDLVALRSDRLLLVTPVARPSRIARCLSLGELVCTALDALFEVKADAAPLLDPLNVQLFESLEEYLARTAADRRTSEAGLRALATTVGHYDSEANLSRLFVPAGDDRFDGVLETVAHEMTHHWVDQRMPRPPECQHRRYTGASPNYFLEEGLATMVEEFRFDLEARTFEPFNPRADSLDVVANAKDLLPFDRVIELSQLEFHRLSREPVHEVPFRWSLGSHRRLSDANMYYAQAGAVCHWLWNADGGKRRDVLRAWVRDFQCGRATKGEAQRRLQLSPQQVGAAVVAWAREVSGAR